MKEKQENFMHTCIFSIYIRTYVCVSLCVCIYALFISFLKLTFFSPDSLTSEERSELPASTVSAVLLWLADHRAASLLETTLERDPSFISLDPATSLYITGVNPKLLFWNKVEHFCFIFSFSFRIIVQIK